MANRTNFYKNPSYTYNKHFDLNYALQNLRSYNIVTGNAPPPSDEPIPATVSAETDSVLRKRRRQPRSPPPQNHKIENVENDGPMSHQEYIDKRRKEVSSFQPHEELSAGVLETSSSVLNLVAYESDTSTSECEDKQQCYSDLGRQSSEDKQQCYNDLGRQSYTSEENQYSSTSGTTYEVNRVKTRTEQRFALPGEPVCVVCGKYGEYICNETEDDVCSTDCKDELLQNHKSHQGRHTSQNPVESSGFKHNLEVQEFGGDTWDYNRHCWSKKISSLCTYECWKCSRPGHLAADCLLMTSNNRSVPSGESCKQVAQIPSQCSSIPGDLLELYKRCHQFGRNWSAAKCNTCRLSTTLATCVKCSNTFCDSAGHLSEHIVSHPSHQQYYSYKLKRLVKCCKSTCKVTDIKDLLACQYCFNKAFDKFYDMYTATWKAAGVSIIYNSICCEDHFEWHRINCQSANVEDSAYIVRKDAHRKRHIQLSDFIF